MKRSAGTAQSNPLRQLSRVITGMATSDGAGVKLRRMIGSAELPMLDPFLLLDCFSSDDPDDYIAGFPTHPHRGFETVTYMLDGNMRHTDSRGNEGLIAPGGVQWMTAGRGILHSEMPEQQAGKLKGLQLWVNLPKSAKMIEPSYQELSAEQVPLDIDNNGTRVRIIAGTYTETGTTGPVCNSYTFPTYIEVILPAAASFKQVLEEQHNAFVYVLEGALQIAGRSIAVDELGVLTGGSQVQIQATEDSRFVLVAGQPLNEPIARHGPFVMNTQTELKTAFSDYYAGKF